MKELLFFSGFFVVGYISSWFEEKHGLPKLSNNFLYMIVGLSFGILAVKFNLI